MPGPAPKENRRRRNPPARGEMQPTVGVGWQHGPTPEPPDGLLAVSRDAWTTWFGAWFASHWEPADLPGLAIVIGQFDAVKRGQAKANDLTTLVRLMDTYGITPAGQQARRWSAPSTGEEPQADSRRAAPKPAADSPYGHLRVAK